MTYDLLIRGGLVVDGTGAEPFEADVAIDGKRIVAIGQLTGSAREAIDARGKLVTPGFVDVHTHYDGQVTWEQRLAPSSNHGVTTVVMGNCGVGFAPCRSKHRELMVRLMEGVEDIPDVVMTEGLPWNWESFPDYLDALSARHADVDFAAQLPHSPLRVYVMGERGAALEPPTAEDLSRMRALTAEAVRAGAIGVSTSRQSAHRFRDGRPAPSVNTAEEEVLTLAAGLSDAGRGVFQMVPDTDASVEQQYRPPASHCVDGTTTGVVQLHAEPWSAGPMATDAQQPGASCSGRTHNSRSGHTASDGCAARTRAQLSPVLAESQLSSHRASAAS